MTYAYPYRAVPDDNGTLLVTLVDFSGATDALDAEDAKYRALGLLEEAIAECMRCGDAIPPASPVDSDTVVMPSALTITKMELYRSMQKENVRKADLARKLSWNQKQVDRVLDVTHKSKLGQMEAALSAMGKRLVITVEDLNIRE